MSKKRRIKAQREAKANKPKGKTKTVLEGVLEKLHEQIARDEALLESELKNLETQKAELLADLVSENAGGRRTLSLGDILNDDQMQAVVDILNRTNLDDIAQTKLLKQYLNQFSRELQAVGVLPEYLAYVLIANADNLRAMARNTNQPPPDPFQAPPNSQN